MTRIRDRATRSKSEENQKAQGLTRILTRAAGAKVRFSAKFSRRETAGARKTRTCPMGNDENIPLLPGYNLTLPGVSLRARTLVRTRDTARRPTDDALLFGPPERF
ncbi:hypothetical protein N9M16_00685 [Candidatus Dependentiae bacterium]|nr:hypothetical protein [Candidatus Dependentiae bacterium]